MRPFALIAALTLAAAPAAAQDAPTSAFVIRLGNDTTAVERYTRGDSALSIEQVLRVPRTSWRHTHLALDPGGEVATIFLMHHQIGGAVDAPLLASTTLTRAGDSATVVSKRGDSTVATRRVPAAAGMIPSLPGAFFPYELAAMRLRSARAESTTVTLLGPDGSTMPVIARRLGADSMTFTLPFLTYRARVDDAGRLHSLYVPNGTSVERVADVNVTRVAEEWKRLDDAGRAMGPLSPLDSASWRIGPATVSVRYFRPSARGREIWGTLVPFDSVWRTGANDATVFATDRDLVIGGTAVPAGKYSLFTVPARGSTVLILNRETVRDGEPLAGTDRDPSRDFARIAMATQELPAPVETLTLEVLPRGASRGTLRIAWGSREMTVPVEAR